MTVDSHHDLHDRIFRPPNPGLAPRANQSNTSCSQSRVYKSQSAMKTVWDVAWALPACPLWFLFAYLISNNYIDIQSIISYRLIRIIKVLYHTLVISQEVTQTECTDLWISMPKMSLTNADKRLKKQLSPLILVFGRSITSWILTIFTMVNLLNFL